MFSHYPGGRAAYGLLVLRLVLAARLVNDGGERILHAIDSGVPDAC